MNDYYKSQCIKLLGIYFNIGYMKTLIIKSLNHRLFLYQVQTDNFQLKLPSKKTKNKN